MTSKSFIFHINNFTERTAKYNYYLLCPPFRLYEDSKHIEAKLHMFVNNSNGIILEFVVCDMNLDAKRKYSYRIRQGSINWYEPLHFVIIRSQYTKTYSIYMNRSDILINKDLYLINDTLTVRLSIDNIDEPVAINNTHATLSNNLDSLMNNEDFSDMKIFADGACFNVHKAIMTARSDVFHAMFSHNMLEACTNVVHIKEFHKDVVREFIRFIYTDTVNNLPTLINGILDAAEKYNIQGLKRHCEKYLCKSLSIKTAVRTLLLANVYNMDELLKTTSQLIEDEKERVVETSDWKETVAEYTHLLHEILQNSKKPKIPVGPHAFPLKYRGKVRFLEK
ncbi:BTB POZ roadkill-like [Drosophila suzukii associated hytrosavirus 1]|nr:BTB POZ roadkill-like [Drosophila suzukii associated hytrosavirus 1]